MKNRFGILTLESENVNIFSSVFWVVVLHYVPSLSGRSNGFLAMEYSHHRQGV
jgi:hypothetical protein